MGGRPTTVNGHLPNMNAYGEKVQVNVIADMVREALAIKIGRFDVAQ